MRPRYEVAEVIQKFLQQLPRSSLTGHHRRILEALRKCRTAELGGHIDSCDECGYLKISYTPVVTAIVEVPGSEQGNVDRTAGGYALTHRLVSCGIYLAA